MAGLVSRLAIQDSVQELDAARMDRYWDALCLGTHVGGGREFGACYLFGYVIEISLKVAYFRFLSIGLTDNLRPYLAAASPSFRRRKVNLHNVEVWAEHLLQTRQRYGRPLEPVLAAMLLIKAKDVALNWAEWMRYRRSISASDDVSKIHALADWFIDRHHALWS